MKKKKITQWKNNLIRPKIVELLGRKIMELSSRSFKDKFKL